MELLLGSDILVQTKDGSTDRHFSNYRSYLLNDFFQLQPGTFYWCIKALDFVIENNVLFLSLTSCTSHKLQPIDVAVRELSGKYQAILNISRTGRVTLM